MQKNVASQKLIVFAFDSTTNLPKTGDAANLTAYVSIDYGSVTVLTDTSATEMDATNAKGYYLFDLSQAETNGNTLLFSAKSATSNIVVLGAPAVVQTVPSSFVVAPGSANALTVAGSNAATTFSGLTTGALSCTTITASGAVAFQSTFAVTTSTSLAALSATTVTFSGAVAFQSTFAVTTSTSLAALSCTTLTASGAVAFQSTFAVTTSTSLAALSATTITASGTTSLAAVTTSGTVTLNALTVSNATTLSGAVSLGSTLSVTGTTTLAALSMTTLTASGAVAFQSTFAVTTSTSLAALSATTVTFSGAVAFQSTFAVTTSTSLGALSCTTLTASGAVAFQSTFATTGTTTFNAFTVTNALTVSGTTSLAAVTTSGTVTMNALTVSNVFTVSGATTLTGAVTASNASNNIVGIDVAKISGDSTAADNAESFFDGTGYAGTNNVIPTVTTVTNQLTAAQVATGVWTTTTAGDFANASSPGKILVTQLGGAFTTTSSSIFSTAALANAPGGSAPTAAQIATAVWQDTTAGDFTTAGSIGKSLAPATLGTAPGAAGGIAIVGSAMTLSSAYDFAKGTVAVTESYNADGSAPTPVQALMVIMQMLTELSFASTTGTVKKLDGSTTAYTLTINSATTPTSITRAT